MAQKTPVPVKPNPTNVKDPVLARSFYRDDFPVIRKAGITFGVCVMVAVALISASRFLLNKQEASQSQAQAELGQAREQYTAATNEKNDIRDFQPKYIDLVRRNFVGEEKRLDVIEHVHSIQENRKLLPITYEIFPQQIVQVDPALTTGELELRGSKLVLHMGLLHELDMFTFLTDLRTKGAFVPQACSIKPIAGARESSLTAQLEGECSLVWITMGRRASADGAPAAAAAQ